LLAPLAEHRFRTSLYLKLAEASEYYAADRMDTKEATILYVSKSFGFKDDTLAAAGISDAPFSPLKEFVIERNDETLKTSLAKATALNLWRKSVAAEKPLGLPCGICSSAFQKRSQACPVAMQCFSGKYPMEITWMENGAPKHGAKKVVAGA
jgi:hypothetical protein